MLQSFKDRIRGSRWLGYAIVGIISVPFALWGIEAYIGGGGTSAAAEVNGEEIPERLVDRQVARQRQALAQRFGGELPDAFSNEMLRNQVLERLIRTRVLQQAAAEAGLRATPDAVAAQIRGTPAFQRDGGFDRELYRRLLENAGMTPEQYERQIADSVLVQQLRAGVANTAFVLPGEARRVAQLTGQERRVASLSLSRAAARDRVAVDEAALEAYYEANKARFEAPEQVRLEYVQLDLDALRGQVEVSEEDLRREYESAGQRYREAAARKASHILLEIPGDGGEQAVAEVREQARELRRRLVEGGADFAELAREYSDDPGSAGQGGDLGFVTSGMMVEPFEEALFGLPETGAVSEPVRTQYGIHLIRLDAVREREQKPFAEVRDQIARELRTRRAENRFYERVEALKNAAFENPGGLGAVADATGLDIRESEWISRREGEGIGSNERVRRAAFAEQVLEERRNSDVIELGDRRVVVVRVAEHRPSRPRPLEAVRERVRAALVEQRTGERLQAWSDRMLERLRDGAGPQGLADDAVAFDEHGWIASSDSAVDPGIVRTAFAQPPPGDGGRSLAATDLADGGRAVVIVRGVRLPDVTGDDVQQVRQQRRQQLSQAEFRAWVGALREAADVRRSNRDDGGQAGAGS